eukprot:gene12852-3598_t
MLRLIGVSKVKERFKEDSKQFELSMLRLIGVSKVRGKVQGGFQTVRVIHASTYRGFESKGIQGIPAALSGACAGYPYDLTVLAEFSWMKVSGSGLLYFVIGPLFSVLAITLSYALIFYELRSYIGGKYDYPYRRAM